MVNNLPNAVRQAFGGLLQTVLRLVKACGFITLRKRWVVESAFGWLGRCRRHSKVYERDIARSEAMIYFATSHIVLRRLASKNS
jgi:putative transposase